MQIKMAVKGKTDAELLEMIYNTSPHSKVDKESSSENMLESNVSETVETNKTVEKDIKDSPATESFLKENETKQELFDNYDNLVTSSNVTLNVTQSVSHNVTHSDDKDHALEVDSSSMDITNDGCYKVKVETFDEPSKLVNCETNHTYVIREVLSAVKTENKSNTYEAPSSQTTVDDACHTELYLLSKEELVNKLISCREELNSLRKQLFRSERQLAKSDDYNELLREKVETLSSQIHSYKKGVYTETAIQVDQNDLINFTIGEPCMPDWGVDLTQGLAHPSTSTTGILEQNDSKLPDDSGMSIADSIKMAAQDVVNKQTQDTLLLQGYVYDETYGLYYHSQSGYYYDSEKMLYYEPHSGTYYYYDYDTGQYAFHSQVNIQDSQYGYGYGETTTTNTQKTKVTHSSTDKSATSRKKKASESRTKKAGGKVSEQVFKNRQERRKAMRNEREREIKRKKENRNRKDRDRQKSKSSKKKKKRKRDDQSSDIDEDGPNTDRKKRNSSKKHRKHRKKEKKEKKHKRDLEKEDNKKINENPDVNSKDITNVKNDINDKVTDVIDISDEELNISEEEGELNGDACMDVDEHQASEVKFENVDIKYETRISGALNEVENKSKSIEINAKSELDLETISSCEESSEVNEVKEIKNEKHDQYESISDGSESCLSSSESESGEISDSSRDQSDRSSDSEDDFLIVEEMEENDFEEEITEDIAQSWRPCVRVIVSESNCIDVGMLYIITYQGLSIGRGKENGICIPDINVSKFHADIQYNDEDRNYTITDKGSQNGTFVNSERISLPKETSEPKAFKHGDVVQVGDTKLLCHIHSGTDTCDDCEPGIVMAKYRGLHPKQEVKFLSKEERKKMQRQELNEIKKRYGLKNAAYEDPSAQIKNPNYEDKAAERRKTVGSDTPHIKHETPASVHRPISSENKGHKMLEKMGWKEGESLGKDNSGIQEPISVSLRSNQSAGLGSGMSGLFSVEDANSLDIKKANRRMQALQRYTEIEKTQVDNIAHEVNQEKVKESNTSAIKSASKYKMTWTKGETEFT